MHRKKFQIKKKNNKIQRILFRIRVKISFNQKKSLFLDEEEKEEEE